MIAATSCVSGFPSRLGLQDFATLNAVYGAFGGIMALLLWFFLSGCILIFGACLCAGQPEALGQPATR